MPDDDYGPWDDSLGDAFAAMDDAHALDGQRIGLDIVAELDRRPSVETRIERALSRIEQGVYTEPAYDPYDSAAGTCDGQLDDFGRCASRFHAPGCMNVVEASAATSDAAGATAWRNVLLGYTPPPEVLGYTAELAAPGWDGDDLRDHFFGDPGGQDAAIREQVLACLGEPGGVPARQLAAPGGRLPDVGSLRTVLGI